MDRWNSSHTLAGQFRDPVVFEQLPSFKSPDSIYADRVCRAMIPCPLAVCPASRGLLSGVVRMLRISMPDLIEKPTIVAAAGNLPKRIAEYVGRVNSATEAVSIARMESPAAWSEPGQTPDFDEYTVVLRGILRVETSSTTIDVKAGQAIAAHRVHPILRLLCKPSGCEGRPGHRRPPGRVGALQHAGTRWR